MSALTMDYAAQERGIRAIAERVLSSGEASLVIGFRKHPVTGRRSPAFVRDPANCASLVWDAECDFNLAVYLRDVAEKAAVVMKPCDVRLAVNLAVEGQIARKNLVVIGVACGGVVHEGRVPSACLDCGVRFPPDYDYLVEADGGDWPLGAAARAEASASPAVGVAIAGGDIGGAAARAAEDQRPADPSPVLTAEAAGRARPPSTSEFLSSPPADRRQRFQAELDKCILCFACRQACAGCYCPTCFMDRGAVDWKTAVPNRGDKETYHLTRMSHLAGRCVGCGACEKACPAGVDLSYLHRGLREFVGEAYGYEAGLDPAAKPAMNSFSADDPQTGFLGGK